MAVTDWLLTLIHSKAMKIPCYEILCLAKPLLPRAQLTRMMQRTGELVMSEGGIVMDVISYGDQSLAYDIRKPFVKFDKAHIWQMNFVARPETLAKLDTELKLNEDALRWLVVKKAANVGPHHPSQNLKKNHSEVSFEGH